MSHAVFISDAEISSIACLDQARKKEGNGNSERSRGREGMKIDRLRMKEKEFWNKLRIFLK